MTSRTITIENVGEVTIYKRHNNRSVRLSFDSKGRIVVSQPPWLPFAIGISFAKSRIGWIKLNRPPDTNQPLTHGARVGKNHIIRLEPSPTAKKTTTKIADNNIFITYPAAEHPRSDVVQIPAQKAAHRALRKESEAFLPQRLRILAQKYGYSYKSVHVKPLKTRWGSCDAHQNITLNIFLMQLPSHLIDYVILHELAHTKVMQHGKPFWDEMELYTQNAKPLRKEIAKFRPILTACASDMA